MPGGWRGSRRHRGRGVKASTVHAGLRSSVFLFREDSHKVLYTESSILSYLPDPLGTREDTRWERRRGGSLPFWRAVHWNEWPCPPLPSRPFIFFLSSSSPRFYPVFTVFLFLSLSLSLFFPLSPLPPVILSLVPRTYLSSLPFRSPATLLSSLLPQVTPPANLPGLLILRQRTLKAQPKASFE